MATIHIQHVDGTVEVKTVTAGPEANQVYLDSPPRIPLNLDPEKYARPGFLITKPSTKSKRAFLVTEKEPREKFTTIVRCVNYDARYYGKDGVAGGSGEDSPPWTAGGVGLAPNVAPGLPAAIMANEQTAIISLDHGDTWNQVNVGFVDHFTYDAAGNGKNWLLVGEDSDACFSLLRSSDVNGTSWQNVAPILEAGVDYGYLFAAAWSDPLQLWVVGGVMNDLAVIYSSPTGEAGSWALRYSNADPGLVDTEIVDITWDPTTAQFVALETGNGHTKIVRSSDGINWDNTRQAGWEDPVAIACSPTTWLASIGANTFWSQDQGQNWAQVGGGCPWYKTLVWDGSVFFGAKWGNLASYVGRFVPNVGSVSYDNIGGSVGGYSGDALCSTTHGTYMARSGPIKKADIGGGWSWSDINPASFGSTMTSGASYEP